MVRASSLMRSTAAPYSSRTPSLRRGRKTVISMWVSLAVSLGLSSSRLLLEARHAAELGDPVARRAPPDLLARCELVALAQNTDAQRIGRLHAFAGCRRVDR